MTEPLAIEFAISLDESLVFSQLSGDYNPLHVDPIAARRTQFGGTVVHGIHAVLKAADLFSGIWLRSEVEPAAISIVFTNPVRSGERVSACVATASERGRIRVTAVSAGHPAFSLTIRTAVMRQRKVLSTRIGEPIAPRGPRKLSFSPDLRSGEVPLEFDQVLMTRLFPNLVHGDGHVWIADLLGSTRIVGMEYPGLDSIYSGLNLARREQGSTTDAAVMRYRVQKVDSRFRLARLTVSGVYFDGTLDTFFRPPAVAQRSLSKVVGSVESHLFRDHRALVIGGSRGLGEIAAKLLIAGGADVTITYAQGLADAGRIRAESQALGMSCAMQLFDASKPLQDVDREWLVGAGFSHVYFFASPHIEKNTSGTWNNQIFERFTNIYVRAFAEVVEAIASARNSARPVRFLYPSSAFLDNHEPGFAEYCAAKAAGEALAHHFARSMNAVVSTPRLPRMRTDQTSALLDVGAEDAFPVILELLRGLRA